MLVLLAISTVESAFKIQPVEVDGTTRNHAHPHHTLLPLTLSSNLLPSIPDPNYIEQLGLTFTQNFLSMAYNVTAVPQTDTNGYGPAYLLNGLSDSGYWYQVGLSYYWPSTAGFNLIYCVFDANGNIVLPSNGGGGISPFSGPVNPGDTVLLSLNFSGGNVFMNAKDWNTAAFAYQIYSDEGATYFMGQPSSSGNPNGFFSGLMTEWYHANPYYGTEEEVIYSNFTSALTSAWMWIDEWNPYTMEILFYSIEFVNYTNPNQLQSFSSNGATESSNAYEFVTGSYGPICIRADGSIDPCAPISTVDNVTYTFTGDIYDSIAIERDNIVLDGDGHMLQGAEYGAGIDLSGRTNVTVEKMQIKAFDYGISLDYASNNTVSENNVTNNGVGISLSFSSNNTISLNNAANNDYGIRLGNSSNNMLVANVMVGNEYDFSVEGSWLSDFVNDVGASNTVGGKPVCYWVDMRGMTVPSDAGYVALVNCTRMTVQDLNLMHNGQGILLAYTTNSTITQTDTTSNENGIELESSSDNRISGNDMTNSSTGIWLSQSQGNNIVGNNVTSNRNGFYLGGSSNNTISGNKVANNGGGFVLQSSSNNNISENGVTANNWGILLNSSSNYNSIVGNEVTANNGCGIFLGSSLDNGIYHNNFVNNSQQVRCDLEMNVWDDGYPSGGNYWSDYAGADSKSGPNQDQPGSDGIGDAGYAIENNNTDHYPLMQPWTPRHNIAVVNVVAAKTVVGKGFSVNVTVLIANKGDYAETFNVTVYTNATAMGTRQLRNLNASQTTLTFTSNTTGLAYGVYTIKAVAGIVLGEANTTDNTCVGGSIVVTIPGDLDGDFAVRLSDLTLLARAYGSKPGDPKWSPNADVDNNQLVGLIDLTIMAQHYEQHYP